MLNALLLINCLGNAIYLNIRVRKTYDTASQTLFFFTIFNVLKNINLIFAHNMIVGLCKSLLLHARIKPWNVLITSCPILNIAQPV